MKTYNEIDIKYYDNDGNIQVRCSAPVTQDALVHYELMQSHYCKLSFKLSKPIYFLLGDFIDTPYGRFELIDFTKAKDNDTIGYSYEILFDAYYRKFKNKILKYRPNTGSQEATFSLTSTISTHVEVIMKSLAYYAKLDKSYLYDPKFEGEGTDYTYVIDASVDANAAKLITYSNTSMLDAIANIAQTFGCEWWFEGNILHFGTCENTNAITDFRLNDNIVSMSSSQSQSTYANRVYAFGAARNLPSGYKNDADADITKDGVVEKRLMLPNSAECSDKNKQLLAENGFELKNGYIQVSGLREDQYVEGVTTNDDIYPRNLIKTSKVTSYEKDVEDESTPEEGDFIKRTFYRVNSLSIINEDGEKTGDMAFRKSYILSGKNLHIVFQSGSLNGMDFECEFNPDGVEEILKDDDGNPILKDGKEQINPKSQVFEIVANEDYGRFLPDTTLHPKEGDTFVLYNWDSTKLGDTLVSAASNELLTDAIKDLKKSMIDPTTYTCTAEANYSYNQGRGNLHGVGDRVNLYNKGYGDSYRASRIIGYEFCLDIPYDGAKYYVGEKPSYSRLNAMESKIEELVYNGQSYLNGNGGGGKSIYIIKSYDKTAPTDYNVYSARAIDEQRLNKTKDDTAQGTIIFEKVQKFLKGMKVGANGDWTLDELDNTHLTTDYLQVRMKAIFETLEILHTDTLGGELFITPVGSNRILKVEEVNITYDGVSQKAYRCYFLGEQDGSKVENKWKVGDQARSKSFNLTQGKYHNVGNHYYWRLVIGVSTETVEIDGKKYHYVDLSDIDKDAASDEPMVDDILNHCGNRTDNARQSCLVFSAVDTYSPSVTLYHGVNGYTFNNKEYVDYGVNHSTNKAFFHVYGDMYFGDRPTSANNYEGDSYIKYDSDKKKVTIKGDLDIKSTYDGKTLDKYITEKSLDKNAVETIIKKSDTITDLQNQIDGAIETWFYDGVPTLKTEPASGWDTDMMKNHLGDLYYDNKTGKAYRFAKDGSTYKWIIITDTELTKAIEDSSQALKDAKSKRRIFGSQPVPPYDVNDMWVNATYPSDGSTYKNEVLRCQTNKAAGSQFAIGDWIKASKYTDDTVANAAKKAAEDAQKAAQTAQTDITNLGKTVTDNKKAFDSYVTNGYLEPSEIAAMAQDSKRLEDDFAAAQKSYNEVKNAEVLKSTKELTDLNAAFATLTTAKTELVTDLSDISKRYNETDTNGKAAIVSAVGTKFTNFQSAYSAFYDKLGLANAYITSKIYGDLKQNITDLAGYKYLKDALGQTTDIDGGLVMTTLLALRDGDGNVQSGINGAIDPNRGKKSIATWWGGQMVDKDYNSGNLTPATSLIRFDGSGYLANGAIWWDVSGKVHADPTSFIISEKNLGAYLIFFEPTWKEGSAGTSVADLVSLKPNAPFSKLGVSGDATFEGAISFHGIKLTYDSTNKAIKIDGNLYATGGITAYGAGASTTGGGGGLNGSVKSYSNALKLTSESLSEIASAYSIKALDSRISSLEGGSATAISVSGSGNAVTSVTKNGTTISVVKGSTFLTSHQSLDGYVNAISVSGSGNAITSVSKSGKGITFTKGATFLTSHQSLANYYTKSSVDSLLSGKSATSHTHSVKINGVTKTIAATGGTAVDLGTYLTSHQSLADYAKKSEIPTKVSQLTNDTGYITSSGSCAYATSAGNADKVDGIHANGLLTALSNSDKGISITVGGTTKSVSNISVNYASSAGNADTVDGYHASHLLVKRGRLGAYNIDKETTFGTRDIQPESEVTISGKRPFNGWGTLLVIGSIDGASNHQLAFTGDNRMFIRCAYGTSNNYNTKDWATVALTSDNVASATKLAAARTIWGQSFDGTGNVNGTIYINNSDSENGAIILNNNVNANARISAIKDQVVFNTGAAIRFGATNWEYSDWAGLKYDTVANAIYLGIADGTVFNYHSNKRSNGTLKFPGITTITPDAAARIGGSGGDLYLGNGNNTNWVKVQDMCSQTNSSLWSIRQDGNAYFKNIYSGAATINGNLSVDGLISNKGILPANYEFNNKGTSCYVSADALCSGITAITDSIQVNQVTVQYSNDSGNSWTNYSMNNDAKFNLYASNAGLTQVYLGYNVITGNNDAEKLAQVKKNELMVTFEISNKCYSQVYFASVDISNGIDTICTVECLNNSGAVVRTYTKHVTGWNQVNYINISEGNAGYGLGSDSNRYIRFRFKHDQKTTALRNTVINKIRIFSFTKYSFPTDRFMGHTGHIYNFDYNMNTYFPNSILAKGGVTAYQSSDIRLKQDLRKLDYFGIIKAMGGTFGFAWKKDNTRSIGWIAQHVLCNPHLKDIVETDEKGYYKINYWSPKLIATAFGAIEQVGDEVSRLKARVIFLESEVQRLSGDKEDCNKKRLDNKNINSLN